MGSIVGCAFGGDRRAEILSVFSASAPCIGVRLVSALTSSLMAGVTGIGEGEGAGAGAAAGFGGSFAGSFATGAAVACGRREVFERIGPRSSAAFGGSEGFSSATFVPILGKDFEESGVLPPSIRGTLSVVVRMGSAGRAD